MTEKELLALEIMKWGHAREYELVKEGRTGEAYQYAHERKMMIIHLVEGDRDSLKRRVEKATTYTIGKDRNWEYDPVHFIHFEEVREAVKELGKKLGL